MTMWPKLALIIGAFYGMTGVMLGAMGAHALKKKLSADLLASFMTGTRYQMYHALALLFLGLFAAKYPSGLLQGSIGSISLGTLLFSGSIYVLVLLRWKVGIITPIGGVFLIVGWALLLAAAFRIQAL